MTITEKILAKHAGKKHVQPGENIWCDVDILMTHDVCGPGTIGVFEEKFGKNAKVWDPSKVVIIPDHYIFTADQKSHRNIQILRDFVKRQGIQYFYDPDFIQGEGYPNPYLDPTQTKYKGVCHKALAEEGHCRPGELLLGTDSHTCTAGAFGELATGIGNTEAGFVLGTGKLWLKVPPTQRFVFEGTLPPYLMAKDLILQIIGDIGVDGATYQAMEFAGSAISCLSIEERMTLANMAIEAGGKSGICEVDEITLEYVRARTKKPFEVVKNDADAKFASARRYDASKLEPVVAKPHSPDNRDLARNCRDVKLDRAYLGSCTGGKITDMLAAARILKGKTVKIPMFVVPATTEVHADMKRLDETGQPVTAGKPNLEQIFKAAGCDVGPASCAACLGGPADTFGRMNSKLLCVSSTNRNFPGRMGHAESGVFLASPLTVAASALTGHVTDPRDVM